MSRRALKWLVAAPAVLLALLLLTAAAMALTLLKTEAGARWLLGQAEQAVPGVLTIESLAGDLSSGLRLSGIAYEDESAQLRLNRADLSISFGISPLTLRIDQLHLDAVHVRPKEEVSKAEPESSAAVDWDSVQPPLRVVMDDLAITGAVLANADGTPAQEIDSILAKVTLGDTLDIHRLHVIAPDGEAELEGRLGLSAPHSVEATLAVRPAGAADADRPRVEIDAVLEGRLEDYRLQASANLLKLRGGTLTAYLKGEGDSQGIRIDSFEALGSWVELQAQGQFSWAGPVAADFDAEISRLQPSAWLDSWPQEQQLRGSGVVQLAVDSIELSSGRIELIDSGSAINFAGRLDPAAGIVSGRLDWVDLSWPIDAGDQPEIVSEAGEFTVEGSPDSWRLEGGASLHGAGLTAGSLLVAASGGRECAQLDSLSGEILDGSLAGTGEFCWAEGGRFSAHLSADKLVTTPLATDWPGVFSLDGVVRGSLQPLGLELDLESLDGTLRGYPVRASGRATVSDKHYVFERFEVFSGDAKIRLDGDPDSVEGLRFLADVPDIGALLPDGSGQVSSSGRLSLAPGQPSLSLQLRGSALEYGDVSLGSIEVADAPGREAEDPAHLALLIEGLESGAYRAELLESEVLLGRRVQEFSLRASGSGLEMSTVLRGSFADPAWPTLLDEPPDSLSWNGEVGELRLAETDRLALDLLKPASFKWSDGRLSLDDLCLTAGGSSSLCLQLDRLREGGFDAGLEMQQLPLEVVQPFVQSDITSDHSVSGQLHGAWSPGGAPSASVDLQISPGNIGFVGEAEALVTTGQGMLAFELEAGRLNSGRFDLPLDGLGKIDLDIHMENLAAGSDALVSGRLYLSLRDLEPIARFIPGVDDAGGRLEADLGLSGTIGQPYLQGEAAVQNGMIENYPLGLRLTDISLATREIGGGRTELVGSFNAREGVGRLTAVLDSTGSGEPVYEMNLRADRLTLFDAEDLRLVARPNIDLGWRDGALEIGGSLHIPEARLAPKQLPASSVSESPDRVIVAGELPGSAESEENAYKARIFGSLDVELGDQVELDLSLAVAKLSGKTRFDWTGEAEPSSNGQLRMDGQIQAFGQLMSITDGRISWRDTPAGNPYLNIRAEREIYGNSEIRRAGVLVTGNVRRLVLEPFTDPMTNRERARTLLVTGSDFNMEKGVGAVDIGTYIAPRLFVSYGIGVFEDENVISIRYDLGRNWGVKATSGQRGTGIDMSYTIER